MQELEDIGPAFRNVYSISQFILRKMVSNAEKVENLCIL
jgi:hypothetical protein